MYRFLGAGYDYTYLYPSIQKVIQAADRVIRTTSDRGVIFLSMIGLNNSKYDT